VTTISEQQDQLSHINEKIGDDSRANNLEETLREILDRITALEFEVDGDPVGSLARQLSTIRHDVESPDHLGERLLAKRAPEHSELVDSNIPPPAKAITRAARPKFERKTDWPRKKNLILLALQKQGREIRKKRGAAVRAKILEQRAKDNPRNTINYRLRTLETQVASLLEKAGNTNGRLERVEAQVTQLIPKDLSTQLKNLQAAVTNLNEFVAQSQREKEREKASGRRGNVQQGQVGPTPTHAQEPDKPEKKMADTTRRGSRVPGLAMQPQQVP